MIPVFITLGSNLSPEHNLPWAVGLLDDQVGVKAVSRVYRSLPLGPAGEQLDQPEYLNAAVLVEVPGDVPPDLFRFRVLRAIENSMGRIRTADRYAPRPIDLDLALYGDTVLEDEETGLYLPDPEILTRAHIALPLADLAPGYRHPVTGQTLREIAAQFEGVPGIELAALSLRV